GQILRIAALTAAAPAGGRVSLSSRQQCAPQSAAQDTSSRTARGVATSRRTSSSFANWLDRTSTRPTQPAKTSPPTPATFPNGNAWNVVAGGNPKPKPLASAFATAGNATNKAPAGTPDANFVDTTTNQIVAPGDAGNTFPKRRKTGELGKPTTDGKNSSSSDGSGAGDEWALTRLHPPPTRTRISKCHPCRRPKNHTCTAAIQNPTTIN
ncbi:hypothetical protein T492DRAFT_1149793, partial [Pavlovales sp. CCMP2436]